MTMLPIREAIRSVLEDAGLAVEDFADCETFLAAYRPGREACLVIDAYLPGMNGLELLERLRDAGHRAAGDHDHRQQRRVDGGARHEGRRRQTSSKSRSAARNCWRVWRARWSKSRDAGKLTAWREDAASHVAGLTPRQRQIMEMVLAGHPSKNIAADLGISQRTVENHRASIMKKTGSKSLPALARLAIAAAETSVA